MLGYTVLSAVSVLMVGTARHAAALIQKSALVNPSWGLLLPLALDAQAAPLRFFARLLIQEPRAYPARAQRTKPGLADLQPLNRTAKFPPII